MMRWVSYFVLTGLLFSLQHHLWWGTANVASVHDLSSQVTAQVQENKILSQRNALLAARIEDLKHGNLEVESRARSELGLVKPGEIFYRVVTASPASVVPDASALSAQGDFIIVKSQGNSQ